MTARLVELGGGKLDKFSLDNESAATAAVAAIEQAPGFAVANLEAKESRRNPLPPFTTSTLQQEASRKLGFSAKRTMQIAQRLYEGVDLGGETTGLITYMRTDGVHMAGEAIVACRAVVASRFGNDYVPERPRQYRAAAKNAQEAHEAIRPTVLARQPQALVPSLDRDQRRLYELIRNRALASQMASARVQGTAIDIAPADGSARLRATGSVTLFDGFLRLYQEGRDDNGEGDSERALPAVAIGDALARGAAMTQQHSTEPPPRYSEATLVKRPGRARHRPAVNLRQHSLGLAGTRIRAADEQAIRARGSWAACQCVSHRLFQALRGVRVHRRSGGQVGRHLGRKGKLEGGAERVLARVRAGGRRDRRIARSRRARNTQRHPRAAPFPHRGWRPRCARVPYLRGRPAQRQDG